MPARRSTIRSGTSPRTWRSCIPTIPTIRSGTATRYSARHAHRPGVLPVMKFGIDRLLTESALRVPLRGKRVALLAHPASVTHDLTHSLDALAACGDVTIVAAFGPQHG